MLIIRMDGQLSNMLSYIQKLCVRGQCVWQALSIEHWASVIAGPSVQEVSYAS